MTSNNIEELNWGREFCIIGEIFGFTPSQISELTLPQFLLYAQYANEQKTFKLDIKTVNEYIGNIFGKKQPKDPHKNKLPSEIECKVDFNEKINNVFNIRDARNSLRRKTGRKEFSMDEIIKEIRLMQPSDKYKIIDPEVKV